jgi:DNA-binding FadR family transcriptional regulator
LTRILDYKVQLLRNIEDVSQERLKEKIALHVPIVEAICRRDAQTAEKLMNKHLTDYYFTQETQSTGVGKASSI